ncbi:MAG: alpha/beta hydrolase [Candidatus Limnocylindrales bacterium]
MSRTSLVGWAGLATTMILAACGSAGAPPPTASSAAPIAPATPTASSIAVASGAASGAPTDPVQYTADIDVGGRTLHLFCVGTAAPGSPTVLGESGLGGDSRTWNDLAYAIGARTRICSYDRAGTYLSPADPAASRTLADQVDDLDRLIAAADIDGPLVLVVHSIGAWHAALFTSRHPEDVVGIVLADPRGPRVSAGWLAALPPAAAGEPAAVAANRDELTTFEQDPGQNDEHLDLVSAAKEASAVLDPKAPLFGNHPLIVLSGGLTSANWADLPGDLKATFDRIWHDGQAALAAESTKGRLEVIADSDHDLPGMRPDAVIAALEDVLDQVGG